ncbi:MAG: BamA/TamA family outer membrane protein [Candidatus Omnitrophica bacterium]|nr:BamA/TamA family outer membrane protein [Candidatus Omnitrophota bacterium]
MNTKVIFCCIFLVSIFFVGDLLAFEDIHYKISCDFNPDTKTIKAEQVVSFRNNTGLELKEIYFRIYPNHKFSKKDIENLYKFTSSLKIDLFPSGFDSGEFQIKLIEHNKENLNYQVEGKDGTVLKVILNRPLKINGEIDIEIDFYLEIPHRYGRYGWHSNIFALHRWYPILSVLDNEGWHNEPDYIFQLPYFSEAATYNVALTLPKEYTAIFGGDLISKKVNSNDTKTLIIESDVPLREFSLAFSKNYKRFVLTKDGIEINSFYLEGDESSAREAAEFANSIIQYYSDKFGLYPYNQFSIAPVYLGYGGNQCSGLVFIDTRLYKLPKFLIRYFEYIIAHETGHQWWYNIVGNNKYKEIWLDEGINVYWLSKYIEDKYGPDAKLLELPNWIEFFIPNLYFERIRFSNYYSITKRSLDSAVVKELPDFYAPGDIFTIAYGKGSGVLHMLESSIGEEKLLEIMRSFFGKFYFKNATIKDFIQICNERAEGDLDWFFNQWLYTSDSCDYAIKKVDKEKIVIQKNGNISMPVETKLQFKDGKEVIDYWDGQDKIKTINISNQGRLKSAYVDFKNKILDFDRVNNSFPRKVDIRLVPLYFGVYEVPVFLREDSYSWITGPAFSEYGFGFKSSFQRPDDYIIYAGSYYDTNAENVNSIVGFQRKHLFARQLTLGFEFLNRDSRGEEDDDLKSYKLYLRKELLSADQSIFATKNHLSLYLIHNQRFGNSGLLSSKEEINNLRYRQTRESIVGWSCYLSNAGPLPDPKTGYLLNLNQEVAGHFLGGREYFIRTSLELDKYFQIFSKQKIALRLKGGGGYPKDKYLFYLGSDKELRGYKYKDIKGSSILMASFEHRFPLVSNINWPILGNIFNLNRIQGVTFFDIGKAWYNHFSDTGFKKDVGFGLRFYFNVLVPIEQLVLRIDFARPLNGDDKDSHIWVGINHAF